MKNRRLLLIEDCDKTVQSLQQPLINMGFVFFRARNGGEGLQLWKEKRPDIVILDVGLPGMSGLEVLRAARQLPALRDTSVLMLTAHKDYRLESYKLWAKDYFTKPISLPELKAKLEAMCRDMAVYRRSLDRVD